MDQEQKDALELTADQAMAMFEKGEPTAIRTGRDRSLEETRSRPDEPADEPLIVYAVSGLTLFDPLPAGDLGIQPAHDFDVQRKALRGTSP